MIKKIIKDLSERGVLPIAIFENTLHVFYDQTWYAIEEDQYEDFSSLKSIIDETIQNLNKLTTKVDNND